MENIRRSKDAGFFACSATEKNNFAAAMPQASYRLT
jgi:hypothetical protein